MAKWHLRSKKAPSGKLLKPFRKKRRNDRGSEFLESKIGETKVKKKRCRGGNFKFKILKIDKANVTDPKTGKTKQAKILAVKENPANPHYARRNILTAGAVIETELGLAKVTSRPGQHGIVNAVLIKS